MTGTSLPLLIVKFVLLYVAAAGLIIAGMLTLFWLSDRVSIAWRARWQARRLQREVDRHLEEVSR